MLHGPRSAVWDQAENRMHAQAALLATCSEPDPGRGPRPVIPLKDDNPTRRPPVLTIGLIVACALVFAVQQTKPDDLHPRQPAGLHLRVQQ